MLNKIKKLHYKDLFLYGFYGSYISITSLATIIDIFIENYFDAFFDFISVLITIGSFLYYLKSHNRELASVILFWIASSVIFIFVVHNQFDISIIFTLLIPMVAFILLPTRKMIIHVGSYFVLLGLIFVYGYHLYATHTLLYSIQNMSAYIIALLFVIAFGGFYHVAIEQSYVELEQANRQKTFLLKEIHHRVKNNLNLVASILGIQKLESNSSEVHEVIEQNRLRLESIAMAHEMLYLQNDLENIDFQEYVVKLSQHILKTNSNTEEISLEIQMISLSLPIESMIQFGIVINELMINSIKYAFETGRGTIRLSLIALTNGYRFQYKDNGKGLDETNYKKGFGTNLIEMSVLELEAELSTYTQDGLVYEIVFKGDTNANSHS